MVPGPLPPFREGLDGMHLMRSLCFLFGGKCTEDTQAAKEHPVAADLGQEKAELERVGKELMSHMKTGSKQRLRGSNECS